jgi:hypothetical protein
LLLEDGCNDLGVVEVGFVKAVAVLLAVRDEVHDAAQTFS